VSTRPQFPGDPSDLHLRISYDDGLWDTPQADTLERWNVAVLHRRRVHGAGQGAAATSSCITAECPSCTVEDATVGSMTFYRVHLDRGRNAYWAMEEESEELYETAQVLLDPETGSFTCEVSELLDYVGSALLVMDRVTLDPAWRGQGLAAVLGCEVIHRLMLGCRAIACSPGVTDLSSQRLTDRSEWDRVNAKIAQGWESLGFRLYRDNVYLLSPASQDLEEQRGELRGRLAELGGSWRTGAS
jgi:GNAT superfamily N-acetyltransferase